VEAVLRISGKANCLLELHFDDKFSLTPCSRGFSGSRNIPPRVSRPGPPPRPAGGAIPPRLPALPARPAQAPGGSPSPRPPPPRRSPPPRPPSPSLALPARPGVTAQAPAGGAHRPGGASPAPAPPPPPRGPPPSPSRHPPGSPPGKLTRAAAASRREASPRSYRREAPARLQARREPPP